MTPLALTLLFSIYTQSLQLPPGLLASVCYVETNHNINAYHKNDGHGNSVGVCQVKLIVARQFGFHGTEKQLMDPATNIRFSAQYLKFQLKRYHGDIQKALTAYNKGNAKGLTASRYSNKVIKEWRQNENYRLSSN